MYNKLQEYENNYEEFTYYLPQGWPKNTYLINVNLWRAPLSMITWKSLNRSKFEKKITLLDIITYGVSIEILIRVLGSGHQRIGRSLYTSTAKNIFLVMGHLYSMSQRNTKIHRRTTWDLLNEFNIAFISRYKWYPLDIPHVVLL